MLGELGSCELNSLLINPPCLLGSENGRQKNLVSIFDVCFGLSRVDVSDMYCCRPLRGQRLCEKDSRLSGKSQEVKKTWNYCRPGEKGGG